jgi:hypothetical protein
MNTYFFIFQFHNGLCVLTQNIINEKIYLALWFWYAFLGNNGKAGYVFLSNRETGYAFPGNRKMGYAFLGNRKNGLCISR